jgi:hypothetical protein
MAIEGCTTATVGSPVQYVLTYNAALCALLLPQGKMEGDDDNPKRFRVGCEREAARHKLYKRRCRQRFKWLKCEGALTHPVAGRSVVVQL